MVCYICNSPASLECPECHRYVCTKHSSGPHYVWPDGYTYFTSLFLCENCGLWEIKRKQREEEEIEAKRRKESFCDFCGKVVDEHVHDFVGKYGGLPRCHKCDKSYCSKHGQIVYAEWDDYKTYYWYRCINHLKKHGILGHHKLTGFFKIMFIGKPDYEKTSSYS